MTSHINIYNIYFKEGNNKYRVYDPYYKVFKSMTYQELTTLSHKYEVFQGYKATDEGILEFYQDFKVWNNELKTHYDEHKSILTFFYFKYNNEMNVLETFNRYAKPVFNLKHNKYDRIDGLEGSYFERCNNGGLSYCTEGIHTCWAYDFTSFYPTMLGSTEMDFQIPLNKGTEGKLSKLDFNNIKYGFYKVKIECENEFFKKQFNFSKTNIYTHYSLLYAINKQQMYDITIELDTVSEFNCYLYKDEDLIYSHKIFGTWYSDLIAFKTKHPKNKCVKHLLSSLWGSLSKKKKFYVKEEDLGNYKWGTSEKETDIEYIEVENIFNVDNPFYTLRKIDDPYEYNIRLKPFLLSYSRNIIGNIVNNNHPEDVVRVFCDSITYNKNINLNNKYMVIEDKSCGSFYFKNSYNLSRLCKKCNEEINRDLLYCSRCI